MSDSAAWLSIRSSRACITWTEVLQHYVPGTSGQPHQRIWGGHFIQEDRGDELARIVLAWLGTSFPKDIK